MNIKNLLLIVVALVAVGAAGGFTAIKLARPAAPAAAHKEEEPVKLHPMELDEFIVNLSDTDAPHYLKTSLVLDVAEEEEGKKEEGGGGHGGGGGEGKDPRLPAIRDAIISTLTRRKFNDLLDPEGKERLKKDIRHEVNKALKKELVHEVYFTSFAMQ